MTNANDITIASRPETVDIDHQVHTLLARYRKIAVIWCIDDVRSVRPDLSEEQAWEVLQQVRDIHDAAWGICWQTLEIVAGDLFPRSPDPSPSASA